MAKNAKAPLVAQTFTEIHLDGGSSGPTSAGQMRIVGHFVFSYDTPIAMYWGGKFYVAQKFYSATTSIHRNAVARRVNKICPSMLVEVNTIKDALETENLKPDFGKLLAETVKF